MTNCRAELNRSYVRYLIAERGWSRQVEASAEYEIELALDYLKRKRKEDYQPFTLRSMKQRDDCKGQCNNA